MPSLVAVEALPLKLPLNVVATSFPAVVSKYTFASFMRVPVLVLGLVEPTKYALVVLLASDVTFVSVQGTFTFIVPSVFTSTP